MWGNGNGQRKAHLLNWDCLCLPKREGGIDFKNLILVNDAFLLKLAWVILTKEEALWVQVMKGKYFHNMDSSK